MFKLIKIVKALFYGLVTFFKLTYTALQIITKLPEFILNSLKTLFGFASTLPAGLLSLAVIGLGLGLFGLILKVVRG